METVKQRRKSTVVDYLFVNPYDFDFHQIIFILEKLNPDKSPLGEGSNPHLEPVKIISSTRLSVSSSQIQYLKIGIDKKLVIMVNFLGIAGIQGALPSAYTEVLQDRVRHKDYAFRDFLDIFNHRLVSNLHKLRKRFVVGLWQNAPQNIPSGKFLQDLAGLGLSHRQNQYGVMDRSLLTYGTLFWMKPRSARGLEILLKSYFNLPSELKQWQGGWIDQPLSLRSSLGGRFKLKEHYNKLGQDCVLARRVWNQSRGVQIVFGPVAWNDYLKFRPFAISFGHLKDLILFYAGPLLKFKISFIVKKNTIKPIVLGKDSFLGYGSCLGKNITQDIFVNHFINN